MPLAEDEQAYLAELQARMPVCPRCNRKGILYNQAATSGSTQLMFWFIDHDGERCDVTREILELLEEMMMEKARAARAREWA